MPSLPRRTDPLQTEGLVGEHVFNIRKETYIFFGGFIDGAESTGKCIAVRADGTDHLKFDAWEAGRYKLLSIGDKCIVANAQVSIMEKNDPRSNEWQHRAFEEYNNFRQARRFAALNEGKTLGFFLDTFQIDEDMTVRFEGNECKIVRKDGQKERFASRGEVELSEGDTCSVELALVTFVKGLTNGHDIRMREALEAGKMHWFIHAEWESIPQDMTLDFKGVQCIVSRNSGKVEHFFGEGKNSILSINLSKGDKCKVVKAAVRFYSGKKAEEAPSKPNS